MALESRRIIQNVIPDFLENFSTTRHPLSLTEKLENPESAAELVARHFQYQGRSILGSLQVEMERFESGVYRARMIVGKQQEASRHPHDFIFVKKEDSGMLYFVDPEHQMGRPRKKSFFTLPRKGDFKPRVSTLMAVDIPQSGMPTIATLRFRTSAIQDYRLLKLGKQFEMAQDLLETGKTPAELEGKENEITFQMHIRPDVVSVQSRGVRSAELREFLTGAPSSAPILEGKVRTFGIRMNEFLTYMHKGFFKKLSVEQTNDSE